jgi:hypothetical protein
MSVAVWVGIIALVGLDAETGVVMLLYLRWPGRSSGGTSERPRTFAKRSWRRGETTSPKS